MRDLTVVYDKYGIDPLSNTFAQDVMKITVYTEFEVTLPYVGRLDLIADDAYGTPEMYFVILEYNSLGHETEIEAGDFLKIPSPTLVMELLTKSKKKPKQVRRTKI